MTHVLARPFQVALYELVSFGEVSSRQRNFPPAMPRTAFAFPTQTICLAVREARTERCEDTRECCREFFLSATIPASNLGGTLVITATASRGGKAVPTGDIGTCFKAQASGTTPPIPVLPDRTYPATWQAWRLAIAPGSTDQPVDLTVASKLKPDIHLEFQGYFIPNDSA